jgi:hypothetical protein
MQQLYGSLGFTMKRAVYGGMSGYTPANTPPIYENPPREFPKSQTLLVQHLSNRDGSKGVVRFNRPPNIGGSIKRAPHCVVCFAVLNLPSQVGSLPESSALAPAYRVPLERLRSYKCVLAQDR